MTQYVILDTNILIRYVTQGVPGCEPEYFDALKELVRSGRVRLFASEVVDLEFEMESKEVPKKYTAHSEVIKKRIIAAMQSAGGYFGATDAAEDKPKQSESGKDKDKKKPEVETWNEMGSHQSWLKSKSASLQSELDERQANILTDMNNRIESILSFYASANPVKLPFDENVMLRTKKRFIQKRFTSKEGSSKPESDYNIVDSIVRHFEKNQPEPVLVCCCNVNDFGLQLDDGKYTLHPFIKDDLPPGSGLFLTLAELVAFINAGKPVEDPPEEQVKEAVEQQAAEASFNQRDFISAVSQLYGKASLLQQMQITSFKHDELSRKKLTHLLNHIHRLLEAADGLFIFTGQVRTCADAVAQVATAFLTQDFALKDGLSIDLEILVALCDQISRSLPPGDQTVNFTANS